MGVWKGGSLSAEGKEMERVTKYDKKVRIFIENICFPVLLLLYPLLLINQGLDVADTTYSLTNFQYFGQMKGTWMVATFLANVVGSLFMKLPFGDTMVGMNFYTSLVQSATALMVYLGLRKRIPALLLFLGEMMALGLCWCPSTILYNYLTYLLMTAALLFLYKGLTVLHVPEGKAAAGETLGARAGGDTSFEKGRRYFLAAGVCLGANVAVRMPNVVQAAFIVAVWYGVIVIDRERTSCATSQGMAGRCTVGDRQAAVCWGQLVKVTVWCLAGYILGFGIPLAVICIRYGFSAYPDMVASMFAMTERAADYKPASMLTGMFGDYIQGLYWMVFAGICMAVVWLALFLRQRLYGAKETVVHRNAGGWSAYKITGVIIKLGYICLLLLLLRFYWGRGMFTFHYYEYDYRSVYYPTVLFLLAAVYLCVCCMLSKRFGAKQKILAALVLVQIFVTPLGSNNKLQPIINNLFLAVPFALWVVYDQLTGKAGNDLKAGVIQRGRPEDEETCAAICRDRKTLWMIPFTMLMIFVFAQSVGFHLNFVFQDGIWGEPRDTRAVLPRKAAGIYTSLENKVYLQELSLFMMEEGLVGRKAITYGELPGLHYLLDMPPALSNAWPDLDSYRMAEYERDLTALKNRITAGGEPPVIILSTPAAAFLSDDGEAIVWFGVDMEAMAADEKLQQLAELMREYGYAEVFGNARYVVYQSGF